jgi:hypothetical protein
MKARIQQKKKLLVRHCVCVAIGEKKEEFATWE